jgi:hypothetical protein
MQQLGKHIPATNVHTTTEGNPLLDNRAVNTVSFVGSVPRSYKGIEKMQQRDRVQRGVQQ